MIILEDAVAVTWEQGVAWLEGIDLLALVGSFLVACCSEACNLGPLEEDCLEELKMAVPFLEVG